MINENRKQLDELIRKFKEWLYIEDPTTLYTLAATKISHQLPGDTIWLMLIGQSSGGKTEYLRALKKPEEEALDDLTVCSFISGYKNKATDDIPQYADNLRNKIWYIYDLSILMSKSAEIRSELLSQLRMIYDGALTKPYGNKQVVNVNTSHNTLICATTPAVDNTILEDQLLGTRFVQYRMPPANRKMIMEMIDQNNKRMDDMRFNLQLICREWEHNTKPYDYELTKEEEEILHRFTDLTTLLRTSIAMDRQGEPMNVASAEDPGRFYKQITKLYRSYRVIGLNQDEAVKCIRKVCLDNLNPIRVKILKCLFNNTKKDEYGRNTTFSTTKLHSLTGMGKKSVKQHMHSLNLLGLVSFQAIEETYGRSTDQWTFLDSNLNLLLSDGSKEYVGKSLARIFCKKRV